MIRPPYVAVSGLGESAAQDLMRAGESSAEYVSIDEIGAVCSKVSQTHLDTLKRLGAFGDMPDSSQVSFDGW